MRDSDRTKEFLNKLAKLLAAYNARICFRCSSSSDTHGLHNDRITVSIDSEIVLDTDNDWYLSSNNIKNNML